LFAPDGDLVANAPFIPIHLGAMSLYDPFSSSFHRFNAINSVL
jgi:5-oxoprolinase (ATP-hydrolysing)